MDTTFVVLTVAAGLIGAFLLGYTAAEHHERRAKASIQANYNRMQKMYRALIMWAQESWPTEFAAYWQGHKDGYQQGIWQAPEMEARAQANDEDAS